MSTHTYDWGNNPVRAALKGRPCRILATGTLSSAQIEMTDTGERLITSRRALRKNK